jgi:hypothetical protein
VLLLLLLLLLLGKQGGPTDDSLAVVAGYAGSTASVGQEAEGCVQRTARLARSTLLKAAAQ